MVGEWWAPVARLDLRPFAGHQPAVPPQDRVRSEEEARPAPTRQRTAQHRQQSTVGRSELGSLDLPAEHGELVAQDGDLDVLGVLAAEASEQHADESARHEVDEGQCHRPIVPYLDPRCSAHPAGFLNPDMERLVKAMVLPG